jgi:hypothetical protein
MGGGSTSSGSGGGGPMDPLSLLACAIVAGAVSIRRHASGWRHAGCERRHV